MVAFEVAVAKMVARAYFAQIKSDIIDPSFGGWLIEFDKINATQILCILC